MLNTHGEALGALELIRWEGTPTCPYCGDTVKSAYKSERRYRCNSCFTSYSVTVGTLFHRSHVGLEIWFKAIVILLRFDRDISQQKLANLLGVTKATSANIINRVLFADPEQSAMLEKIVKLFD